MATPLTGNTVASTYEALIKVGDNTQVTATLKVLSDGLGTNLPVEISTTTLKVTGILNTIDGTIVVDTPTTNDEAANKGYVDTQVGNEETARINADAALQSDIDDNAGAIQVIQLWTISDGSTELLLGDNIQFTGTNGITVTANDSNNTITIDGSGVAGGVSSVNSLTGDVTLSGGTNVTLDVVGNNIEINASGTGGAAVDSVNSLTGALTIQGANGIAVTDDGTDTITIDGSSVVGAVTSVNGDTGDVQVEAVYQTVKNASGAIMYRGTPVHTTGVTSGQQPDVVPADASSNYPADYILNEDINAGASGQAISMGLIEDVNLTPFGGSASAFSPGDEVYLAAGGGFTITRPTGTNAVQPLGRVLKVNVGGNQISGKIDNLGHASVDDHGLPNLPQNFVWEGNINGVPVAVNQNTLSVASAVNAQQAAAATTAQTALYADDAANLKIDAVTSGTFRVILGDDGEASGAYQRLKSDVSNGFTYNPSGDVVSAGAFTSVNAITAGGALIGGSLDISGNADIDGTLTLGGIGNVEGEINQNASDIAALQAIPQYAPVVTETASFLIEDDTYEGKFVVCNSSSAVEIELEDSATYPANVGDEIYFMQQGTGQVQIIALGGTTLQAPGNLKKTRAQYSTIGIKYLGSNVWVVMGDLGV
jgi:hypothetical protein